jgi:hypothetical protein
MRVAWRIAALLQGVMLKPLSAIVELLILATLNIGPGKKTFKVYATDLPG